MSDLGAADSSWEDVKLSPHYCVSFVVCFLLFNFFLAFCTPHLFTIKVLQATCFNFGNWDPLVDPGLEHLGNLHRYCVSLSEFR